MLSALSDHAITTTNAKSVANLNEFLSFLLDAGTRDRSPTIVMDCLAYSRLVLLGNSNLPYYWCFYALRILSVSRDASPEFPDYNFLKLKL